MISAFLSIIWKKVKVSIVVFLSIVGSESELWPVVETLADTTASLFHAAKMLDAKNEISKKWTKDPAKTEMESVRVFSLANSALGHSVRFCKASNSWWDPQHIGVMLDGDINKRRNFH